MYSLAVGNLPGTRAEGARLTPWLDHDAMMLHMQKKKQKKKNSAAIHWLCGWHVLIKLFLIYKPRVSNDGEEHERV